jgi:hypothetical protein
VQALLHDHIECGKHPADGSLAMFAASPQSSRLAEFGGRGMSFNICRGTLGTLAMFTAIRNASSRVSGVTHPRISMSCRILPNSAGSTPVNGGRGSVLCQC